MIANNCYGVSSRQFYDVGIIAIGVKLQRPGESGMQKAFIAHALRSAVEGEQASVEREGVALIDPDRVTHFESACRVLR